MALRPVHVLLLVLPLCAYLFYRAAETEAKVHGLERRIEALDRPVVPTHIAAAGSPSSTVTSAGAAPELAAVRQELTALKAQVEKIEQKQDSLGTPDAILGVVEEEKRRVHSLLVDFHSERWQEATEEVLERLVKHAKLTDSQRERVGSAMTDEVERLAEIARDPAALEDPDTLANDVMQLLDETNTRVFAVLNRSQRAAWERHRARERRTMYPWLPR